MHVLAHKRARRLFIALALGLVALATLRLVVGSAWAQRQIAHALAEQAAEHGVVLHIGGKIDLGFLGTLTLADVTVTHPLAQAHLSKLRVAPDLWALICGRPFFADVMAREVAVSVAGRTLVLHTLNAWAEGATLSGTGAVGGGLVRLSVAERAPDRFAVEAELWDVESHALGLAPALWGRVGLRFAGEVTPRPTWLEGALEVTLRDAFIGDDRLSPQAIGPLTLAAQARGTWGALSEAWRVDDLELLLGPEGAPVARAQLSKTPNSLQAAARLDVLASDVYDALPDGLAPVSTAPRLLGRVGGRLTVQGPPQHPELWTVDATLNLEEAAALAKRAAPVLRASFTHVAKDARGHEHVIVVGPENPSFVPFAELPEHVVRAVTTSEDAGFFAHRGFDLSEIKNSVLAVAHAGAAVRGGSTITQQLAKNLYLTRDKTYARKIQEALITLALEASVRKQRLLEIYLNIIEWGPGVFGIGPAAHYYFGKDPRELTPKEAAYLASIIPNPVRYGRHALTGELSETWEDRVLSVLTKMNEAGTLDAETFEQAKASALVFSSAN